RDRHGQYARTTSMQRGQRCDKLDTSDERLARSNRRSSVRAFPEVGPLPKARLVRECPKKIARRRRLGPVLGEAVRGPRQDHRGLDAKWWRSATGPAPPARQRSERAKPDAWQLCLTLVGSPWSVVHSQ